jgi:SAM-dependent methyltransferase
MNAPPLSLTRFTREIARCEVCGSSQFDELASAGEDRCRIVACRGCGLFFATPTLPLESFADFYDDEFTGDAGSSAGAVSMKPDKAKRIERAVEQRMLPAIEAHVGDLAGKRILDLRSRDGSLAAAMARRGARVVASDPMRLNAERCKAKGLDTIELPITEHASLPMFADESFDVATALTIHLLAHLPEPMAFLSRLREVLVPGGLAFFDEKDVFAPARPKSYTVFDSGTGHLFHLTLPALRMMLERAGFEIVSLAHNPSRTSSFRHVTAVARRPLDRTAVAAHPLQNGAAARKRLAAVERELVYRVPYARMLAAVKSMGRSLGGKRRPPTA